MHDKFELAISLTIFIITIIWVVWNQRYTKIPSVGLPIACLFSISIQHFPGALINALPWYKDTNIFHTVLGFAETTYGVVAFAIGCVIFAPLLIRSLRLFSLKLKPQHPDLGIPEGYIYLGFIFAYLLLPLLWFVPSFQALASSGFWLLVVGLCLACWRAWWKQDRKALTKWILISLSFPVLTAITSGYTSYGTVIVVFVISFILSFYRGSNWKSIIAGSLALLLGLSLFVTYFGNRKDIRSVVWKGGSQEAKIEQFWKTANSAEFFDPFNQKHLAMINDRLNQNILVGQAIDYLSKRNIEYAKGQTILRNIWAVVPRIIWENKPIFIGGYGLVETYTGAKKLSLTSSNTSIAAGLIFEFYVNYGTVGVVIGFFTLGILARFIDMAAGLRLRAGDWQGFMSWYLPGIGIMQYQADTAEMFSTTSTLIVLVILLNRIKIPSILKGKAFRNKKINPYLAAANETKTPK